MSLSAGDFAVALTEKDSERLTLRNELNKLEDLQAAGTDRLLRLTATGLRKEGLTSSRVVYSYSIDHTNVKHNGKAEGEVVDFQLLSEKDVIDIIAEAATFNEDGERTTLTYIAQFPVAKIPLSATTDEAVVAIVADAPEETPATEATNGEEATTETTPVEAPAEKTAEVTPVIGEWVKLSLSAVDGDDADSTATIDVTAKHIAIQEAIVEKTAQMEKAVEEIAELQRRYKASQEAIVNEQKAAAKASTTTTTTKKKATAAAGKRKSTGKVTKKTTKSSQSSADEEDAEAAEEPTKQVAKKGYGLPSLGEIQTYALNAGITALNVALTQRAVLFFAAAAIGVYTVGDYASV